jgi:hypothetical protein
MRIFLLSLLSCVLLCCNNAQKEGKSQSNVSKHSNGFNSSVQSAMDSYHALTEAFVNWDSSRVVSEAKQLQDKISGIALDTANNNQSAKNLLDSAKTDLELMIVTRDLTEKRYGLNALTQHLYVFLQEVRYDEKKIYLHECPMAFDDTKPGDWLSESDSIRNPYLGLHHPTYGNAMIDCGETKSTIDFTSPK